MRFSPFFLQLLRLFLAKKALDSKPNRLTSNAFYLLSGKRDSNPRPSAWEADALPTELLPLVLLCEVTAFRLIVQAQWRFFAGFRKNTL